MNCVPDTVSVKAKPPEVALGGDRELIVGAGFGGGVIAKLSVPEVPPPGAGFCTVMVAVPTALKSAAGICAVSEVPDTKVVATALPFQSTCDVETNSIPATVKVNAGLPAYAVAGESELIVGIGFGGALIVKLSPLDVPPPGAGLPTVILAMPAVVRSDTGTCAVRDVLDT
jgi:hypothetical protein